MRGDHIKAQLSVREVAGMLDLLVLQADASADDVADACRSAARAHLRSVYCLPGMVKVAAKDLEGSGVSVGTVVPGPDTDLDRSSMLAAATTSLDAGAREISVIVNNRWWRHEGDAVLVGEIRALADVAGGYGAVLKVAFRTGELDRAELVRGCQLAQEGGAGILQGGSWFTSDRSTMEELQAMRAAVSPSIVVKGAGYIKSLDRLLLGYAHGLGRFNVQQVDQLLAEARRRSEGGDLMVPPTNDRSAPDRG